MAHPARTNFSPAMAVSVFLHVALFAATLIVIRQTPPPVEMGGATTVTLVPSSALEASPAVEGPVETEAAVEAPVPEADPGPVAEPAPPAPPQAKAAPTPTPSPKPPPAKAAAKPRFDLSALAGELKPSGGQGGGRAGKPTPATSPTPRTDRGRSTGGAAGGPGALVADRLSRGWSIDCSLAGMSQVTVTVRFELDRDGQLTGEVEAWGEGAPSAVRAAVARARSAVGRAVPFDDLPKASYSQWRQITAKLHGSDACS